jgi:DNA-directed RNA polymerase subunit L
MAKNEQVSMEDLKVAYDKDSKRQATFTFNGEDHTLGNLLRSVVSTK